MNTINYLSHHLVPPAFERTSRFSSWAVLFWLHLNIYLTCPGWVWPRGFRRMSGPPSLPTSPRPPSPWWLHWNIDPGWSVLPLNWGRVGRGHCCCMYGCVSVIKPCALYKLETIFYSDILGCKDVPLLLCCCSSHRGDASVCQSPRCYLLTGGPGSPSRG